MHAGGVLIAPGKLTDFCPLYVQPNADAILSQFDKDDVEAVGPRQVRLPRPHHADDPRLDDPLRARCSTRRRHVDLDALPLDDQGAFSIFKHRQHDRRVPVRIARHARAAEAGAGHALRGHHRARRAVPARPDGAHPRLRRAQVGARARRLRRCAPGADPVADVRRDGVPGTGDADRPGDRRLHAGRRRPAAPRDGQEEARGDGQASRHLRRRRDEERRARGARRRSSST